jgi:hypothetical protein
MQLLHTFGEPIAIRIKFIFLFLMGTSGVETTLALGFWRLYNRYGQLEIEILNTALNWAKN